MSVKQYKAFDFLTGYTYLIGAFESKAQATAYCKNAGIQAISQTIVALTDEEYEHALKNRITNVPAPEVTRAERENMLKVDIDAEKKGCSKICAEGNLIEMQSDICVLINHLYSVLHSGNPIVAEIFKNGIKSVVTDEKSPLWEAQEM